MRLAKGYRISDEKSGAVSSSINPDTRKGHPNNTPDIHQRTYHPNEDIDVIRKQENNVLDFMRRSHAVKQVSASIGRYQGFCCKGIPLTQNQR